MSRKRKGDPQRTRPWQPMEQGTINPRMLATHTGDHIDTVEAWGNDVYQCTVERWKSGAAYISVKRHDRHAIRDWRHLQAIKNEVCGPECEAVELFPAESRLVDEANQYHLWVLPAGERFPFGSSQRSVSGPEAMRAHNAETGGKGRQRPFQPGLPVGVQSSADGGGNR